MVKRIGSKSNRLSAQSSSALLGLALAFLLTQSAFLCSSGVLTAFGWALVASLAGCLYAIIFQWTDLIQSRIPEQSTWRKGIISGCLLAGGLLVLGHSLQLSGGSPWPALAIAFAPVFRDLWRRLFVGDTLNSRKEKVISLILLGAAFAFIFPEIASMTGLRFQDGKVFSSLSLASAQAQIAVPRSAALLAAVLLGAASSLQRPQDRSIPSRTFWTIPVGLSAIILSLAGWIAMNTTGARQPVLGNFESLAMHRLLTLSPAFLFGIVMLGIRPHIHIGNAQRIGKDNVYWWQLLGLAAGVLFSLFLLKRPSILGTDALSLGLLLLGQILGAFKRQPNVRFAPALSSVPLSTEQEPILSTQQH